MTKDLKALARELAASVQIEHHSCEDCWHSCPKSIDGCCNEAQGPECNCGADEKNERIYQAILAGMLAAVQRVEIDLLMDDFGQASGNAGTIAAELAREIQK
jgi:hypothetical protein